MTTIASASNNAPVSNPPFNKPNGHFPTKAADRAHRKDTKDLYNNLDKYRKAYRLFEPEKGNILQDIYTALESGVPIVKNPQELTLLQREQLWDDLDKMAQDATLPGVANSLSTQINQIKNFLKKHQDKNGHYNIDKLHADYQAEFKKTFNQSDDLMSQNSLNLQKVALDSVFKENPQLLFEKAAGYPETVKRLVELLDLPAQNDKGWNLTSQAAKAGNPKLANAFENAGFGPNLHHKAMVDFAKAMSDDAPNADKSKALKELMGVTPLS